MLKITLDTNCFINLFDRDSATATSVEVIGDLIRQGLLHNVDLAVTTRVEADLANDRNAGRQAEMLRYLNMLPILPTVFRLDTSKWDRDVWADDIDMRRTEELQRVLFPGLTPADKRYSNKTNDIDHLVGHLKSGRDIFVTDDQGLLKKRDELGRSFGLRLLTPQACLTAVLADASSTSPDRQMTAAPERLDLEISIARKNVSITGERHEYELAIFVRNRSAEVVSGYHVDIQMPTQVLLPGNTVVESQSDRQRSLIRYLYHGTTDDIFPDEIKRFPPVRYFMNDALFWQDRSKLFDLPVVATMYVKGQRFRIEKRFEELQIF